MTQDEIIRMAREAGFEVRLFNSIDGDEIVVGDYFLTDRLKDFANLVAEATKEKIANECDPNWRGYFGYQIASALRSMK